MIERVEIDSDDDGFHLILEGDFSPLGPTEGMLADSDPGEDHSIFERLDLRLPQDVALALLREVDEKIRPWHLEGESVRHDHERYRRTGEVPSYVSEDRLRAPVPPTPRRQEGDAHASPSDLANRADYECKRDRENR